MTGPPRSAIAQRLAGRLQLGFALTLGARNTPTLWPDFRKEHLLAAVADYGSRQRRYGSL